MADILFEDFSDGQKVAFKTAMSVINGTEIQRHLIIKGSAGTGKTTLTKYLIRSLIKRGVKGIILAAPTHQAKKVLSEKAGMKASTIHSVLKIKPDTYEDTQEFNQSEVPDLSNCQVLILDEVSMYDDQLKQILMRTIPSRCTIIGLGDEEQVRSVNGTGKSSIFKDVRFKVVELEQVKRATGAILSMANHIRNDKWGKCKPEIINDENESVIEVDTAVDLLKKYFEHVKTPEDFENNRILCYTNKLVDSCNNAVRKRIYGPDVEAFVKGEVIVLQEPVTIFDKILNNEITLFNNSEWLRIKEAKEVSNIFGLPGVPSKVMIRYWQLNVESCDEENEATAFINIISDTDENKKLLELLSEAAYRYKNKDSQTRPSWKSFWELKKNFTSVKYLPAGTIHKSQGSTIDNVYIFATQIEHANHLTTPEVKELLYTAFSRASKNVYYY